MAAKGVIDSALWREDVDWRGLPLGAQHTYLMLLSQSDLGLAGRISLAPGRWARYTAGRTSADVRADLAILASGRRPLVAVDDETEEVLVRSKIRNDGVWKSPNLMKSALTNCQAIESPGLRRVLLDELLRARTIPGLTGNTECHYLLEQMIGHLSKVTGVTVPAAPGRPAKAPAPDPLPGLPVLAIVPSVTFDTFWNEAITLSPVTGVRWRKEDRPAARRAWDRAVRRADPEVILAGAIAHRDDPNRRDEFTKQPATWLNNDCWTNDPLAPRGAAQQPRRDPWADLQATGPSQRAIRQ